MNSDLFFEKFELLADAPNGTQKLRELILQLAVMGKLVEQDPNDEPASVLIEKIRAEKMKLEKERIIKRSKPFPLIDTREVIFEVPKSWELVRLSEVVTLKSGNTLDAEMELESGDIPYLKVADMNLPNNKKLITTSSRFVASVEEIKKYLIPKNSIIFPKRGGAIATNKKRMVKTDILVDLNIMAITCHDNLYFEYLYYWFLQINLWDLNNGTSVPQINNKDIEPLIFPLPPLAEQKRIVSKVDELMALCDKLEAHRQKKQELQSKLNNAALDRMLIAENQEEFELHWQRICENFDLLYDNSENVAKLRQAILQLAVQGKLLEQNPEDEPASVLIEKILAGKHNKENRSKLSKVIDPLYGELRLPNTWRSSKIEEFSLLVTDGEHNTPTRIDKPEVPLVTAKNVRDGYLDLENTDFISNNTAEKCWKRCNPSHNDILMVCVGATTGRLCLIKNPIKFVLVRSVSLIRVDEKYIYPEYIALAMKSPVVQSQIWQNVKQSAQPCLYLNKIQKLLIPLPPLPEQKRIVEKVEQLMGLCNELEAKLRKEREDSEKLMEAVVKGLLEGTVAGKSESEKLTLMQAAVIQSK